MDKKSLRKSTVGQMQKKKLVIHENFFLLRRILSNPDNDLRVDLKGSIDLLQYYRTNVFKTDLYHS